MLSIGLLYQVVKELVELVLKSKIIKLKGCYHFYGGTLFSIANFFLKANPRKSRLTVSLAWIAIAKE